MMRRKPNKLERGYFCSCGDSHHVLKLTAWDDEPEGYIDVVPCVQGYGIIERVKVAWNIIRKGDHSWTEVLLNPETTDMLIADLMELKGFVKVEDHGSVV